MTAAAAADAAASRLYALPPVAAAAAAAIPSADADAAVLAAALADVAADGGAAATAAAAALVAAWHETPPAVPPSTREECRCVLYRRLPSLGVPLPAAAQSGRDGMYACYVHTVQYISLVAARRAAAAPSPLFPVSGPSAFLLVPTRTRPMRRPQTPSRGPDGVAASIYLCLTVSPLP